MEKMDATENTTAEKALLQERIHTRKNETKKSNKRLGSISSYKKQKPLTKKDAEQYISLLSDDDVIALDVLLSILEQTHQPSRIPLETFDTVE